MSHPIQYCTVSLIAVLSLLIAACDRKNAQSETTEARESETVWLDPNEIRLSPTMHEKLPDELLERIKVVHATFADVDETPLDKWISDFKRDADPEPNVKIWEDMKIAYEDYCDRRELPLETRKEVFRVVLFRSMASPKDVLERIDLSILSPDDASEIMKAYPSEPKPIDVIEIGQ